MKHPLQWTDRFSTGADFFAAAPVTIKGPIMIFDEPADALAINTELTNIGTEPR